jgi:hypothetical protein
MPDSNPSATRPREDGSQPVVEASSSDAALQLSPLQLERWADLVACGDALLPEGLAPDQERQLRQQVRRLRRARLVEYIARQIAQDLTRTAGPAKET